MAIIHRAYDVTINELLQLQLLHAITLVVQHSPLSPTPEAFARQLDVDLTTKNGRSVQATVTGVVADVDQVVLSGTAHMEGVAPVYDMHARVSFQLVISHDADGKLAGYLVIFYSNNQEENEAIDPITIMPPDDLKVIS